MLLNFKKSGYVQNRRNAARLKKEREDNKRHLASIDRIADALEATQDQDQADDDKRAFREKLTILLLCAAVLATVAGDWIFFDTLRDSHKASREQLARLDRQLGSMDKSSAQTDTQIAVNKDLAAAAKAQATAATDAAQVARDNIVSAGRAWVGPNNVSLSAEPVIGTPLEITISYQNSGRQPALRFIYSADVFGATDDDNAPGAATDQRTQSGMKTCMSQTVWSGGGVVYPSTGFTSNSLTYKSKDNFVDDTVVSGIKTVVVQGCFEYVTFNTPHHSYFCFFYKKGLSKIQNLNICPGGHDAD